MQQITLRQLCIELKISRRAVQGYEQLGLVSPSGRNKYGYLLYGEAEQERIRMIQFYQQLGFKLKEIKELLEADDASKKAAIQARITELEMKEIRLKKLIREAKKYIAAL